MGIVFYWQTYSQTISGINKEIISSQNYKIKKIDDLYNDLNTISSHILTNSTFIETGLNNRIENPKELSNILSMPEKNGLITLTSTSDIIKDYFVIFFENETVFNPEYTSSFRTFSDYVYHFIPKNVQTDWNYFLSSQYFPGTLINEFTIQDRVSSSGEIYYPFLRTIKKDSEIVGIIVFLISSKKLRLNSSIQDSILDKDVYIINTSKNEIYFDSQKSQYFTNYMDNLDNVETGMINSFKEFYGIHIQGKISPWSIVTLFGKDKIKEQINYIMKTTTIIIIFLIIAASLILVYIAYLTKIPLLKMTQNLESIDKFNSKEMEYTTFFSKVYNQISGRSAVMKDRMSKNRPFLENMFLSNILNGNLKFTDIKDLVILNDLGLDKGNYRVLLIRVGRKVEFSTNKEREQELILVKLGILDLLNQNRTKGVIPVNLDAQLIGIISVISEKNKQQYELSIEKLFQEIKSTIDEHLEIGVGSEKNQISEIFKSSHEANIALNKSGLHGNQQIVYYSDDFTENYEFTYFPVKMEERLKVLVENGSSEELTDSLKELMQLNLNSKHTGQKNLQLFFSMLKGLIIRIVQDYNFDDQDLNMKIKEIMSTDHEDYAKTFEKFNTLFLMISDRIVQKRTCKKDALKNRIEEYLENHYTDYNLSIISIADHFNYSSQYFSGIFKEIFATTFRVYLENKRLNTLVYNFEKYPDRDLKSLMSDVGYSSLNTFSKAFKRHFGISASEYRSKI